jgi:chromosome segregation ATPase
MEPFVPKPEERISHQSNGATKPRSPQPKTPRSRGGRNPVDFFKNHLHLFVPSIIFLLLFVVLYSVQQQSIATVEKQLADIAIASRDSETVANPLAPPALETTKNAPPNPQLSKQIAALNKQLSSQAAQLLRLEKQVESLSTKADSANKEKFVEKQNQTALDALKTDLVSLKNALESTAAKTATELGKYNQRQINLEESIDKRINQQALTTKNLSSQLTELDNEIDNLNRDFEKNLVAARTDWDKSLTANNLKIAAIEQQVNSIDSLEQSLTTLKAQLINITKDQKQLSTNDKTAESQLAKLSSQLKTLHEAPKDSLADDHIQTAILPLSDQIKNLTAANGQISTELDRLHRHQNQLTEKLATSQRQLDSYGEMLRVQTSAPPALTKDELEIAVLPLREEITSLNSALRASSSGLSSQRQSINSLRDQIAVQLVAIKQEQQQLAATLASNQSQLADLGRISAEQKDTAQPLTRNELEATVRPLQQQMDTIDNTVDSAITKIDEQEKSFASLRSQLETQLIQNRGNDTDNGALDAIQAELAPQLDALRARDTQLYTELSQALKDLKNLQGKVTQLSTATTPTPDVSRDMAALNERIKDLSSRLDTTVTTAANNDSKIARWQQNMELKLANLPSSGAQPGDLQAVKKVINLLMKQHPYTKFPPVN